MTIYIIIFSFIFTLSFIESREDKIKKININLLFVEQDNILNTCIVLFLSPVIVPFILGVSCAKLLDK